MYEGLDIPVLEVKVGDTFSPNAEWTDSLGVAIDITGYTVTSEIRSKIGKLLDTATVTIISSIGGTFKTDFGYVTWPVGDCYWDMKLSVGGVVAHTRTVKITVIGSVTV